MITRGAWRQALLAGLVLLLASSSAASKMFEVHLVATGDRDSPYAFEPRDVELAAGDSVRWINDEAVFHTATSTDSFDAKRANGDWSHTLGSQGSTATQAFDEAGVFYYFCQPHASFMDGIIRVTAGSGGDPSGDESSPLGLTVIVAAVALAALLHGQAGRRGP